MSLNNLNIVTFLKTKMKWHQSRQRVLAENVANADTPHYRPHDLAPMSFQDSLKLQESKGVGMARTHTAHIRGALSGSGGDFRSRGGSDGEITPAGNAVILEEQMMKVSENQFDYQLVSTVYSRSLGLIKTALGRRG